MSDSTFAEKIAKQLDPTNMTADSSGPVLDIKELGPEGEGLQTASDGKTVLIPPPSSDPHDPLNWSPLKKNTILFVITVTAFLADFGSSVGVVTLLPQAVWVAPREGDG